MRADTEALSWPHKQGQNSSPFSAPRAARSRSSDSFEEHRATPLGDTADQQRRAPGGCIEDSLEHARSSQRSGSRYGRRRRQENAERSTKVS